MTASAPIALEGLDRVTLGGAADVAALGVQDHRHVRTGPAGCTRWCARAGPRPRRPRSARTAACRRTTRSCVASMIALLNWKIGAELRAMCRGKRSISGSRPTHTSESCACPGAAQLSDEAAHATRTRALPARFFRCTSRICTAAGVTPGTPTGLPEGRRAGTAVSVWRTSCDRPAELRVIQVLGQASLLVPPRALDLLLRPLDVAGVLGAHLDLGTHLGAQRASSPAPRAQRR